MKFKKVEIQAFRAYDKASEGTFDFFIPEKKEFADFISIYAPNGFGKTSFYDAVEWGFTNNINRFLKRPGKSADSAKAERTFQADMGAREKQHIIRNKFSPVEREGYVKLTTSNFKDPIVNKIPDVRSGQSDFKFKPADTIKGRAFFQDVLLSQEWIDAFLKEDEPGLRYEKFMDYFGDKDLDEYYKSVQSLIKGNEAKIADLKILLEQCQLKLAFDGDREILIKINSHIDSLSKQDIPFAKIDGNFSEQDFLKLSNEIVERKINLEGLISDLEARITSLEDLRTGTVESPGTKAFLEASLQLSDHLNILNETRAKIQALEKRIETNTRLEKTERAISTLTKDLKQSEEILGLFSLYLLQKQAVDAAESAFKQCQEMLGKEVGDIEAKKALLKLEQKRIKTILKAIEENRRLLVDEKSFGELQNSLIQEKAALDAELEKQNALLKEKDANLGTLIRQNSLDQASLFQLTEQNFEILPMELKEMFKPSIDFIRDSIHQKFILTGEINRIDDQIAGQSLLAQDLQSLVIKASELINKSQSSHCPLCDTDFKTFQALSSAVSNNNALSKAMQDLMSKKSGWINERFSLEQRIESSFFPISGFLNNRIGVAQKSIVTLSDERSRIAGIYSDIQKKIGELNARIFKLNSDLNGLLPEEFNAALQSSIDQLTQELEKLQLSSKSLMDQTASATAKLTIFQKDCAAKASAVIVAKEHPLFQQVLNHFKKNLKDKEIELEVLKGSIAVIGSELKEEQVLRNQLLGELRVLIDTLKETNPDRLEQNRAKQEADLKALERTIERFLLLAKTKFDLIIPEGIDSEDLMALLENKNQSFVSSLDRYKKQVQDLSLLELLKENVLPFLSYQKNVQTADELTTRIRLLKEKVGKALTSERDKISAFIHKQVDSFFYEELINVLYKKIDPHPDYKRIKFKCDFSLEKPKLNVFVTGQGGEAPLVPNLYFSTAQMNILSLSIFLAKALNAKDNDGNPVDCIFIDDPIQSMDSINILSTIDLFRSITVNFGKQIILSTHDENFHNLLKKKIPERLFNAKYIELETFGTVKSS